MTILWMLPLLFGTAGAPVPPEAALLEDAADEVSYDLLVSEYDSSVKAWKAAVSSEEDKKAKRALRKKKPAIEFYPRFEAFANSGEGRALVWMMEHLRDAGFKKKESAALQSEFAGKLVRNHVNDEWFDDGVVASMFKQKRALGIPRLEELSLVVIEKSASEVVQAQTLSRLAELFTRSKDEGEKAKGESYFERLEEDYPLSVLEKALNGERFRNTFLREGKVAPDFEAETADGEKFKLSDYRGKVTLIDFWGFW